MPSESHVINPVHFRRPALLPLSQEKLQLFLCDGMRCAPPRWDISSRPEEPVVNPGGDPQAEELVQNWDKVCSVVVRSRNGSPLNFQKCFFLLLSLLLSTHNPVFCLSGLKFRPAVATEIYFFIFGHHHGMKAVRSNFWFSHSLARILICVHTDCVLGIQDHQDQMRFCLQLPARKTEPQASAQQRYGCRIMHNGDNQSTFIDDRPSIHKLPLNANVCFMGTRSNYSRLLSLLDVCDLIFIWQKWSWVAAWRKMACVINIGSNPGLMASCASLGIKVVHLMHALEF